MDVVILDRAAARLEVVGSRDGEAFYRNKFVRTDGFVADLPGPRLPNDLAFTENHAVREATEERVTDTITEGSVWSTPATRTGSQGEDDGYLITMTTDMNADRSECLVFAAQRVAGATHSTWAPGAPPRWRDTVGLAQA